MKSDRLKILSVLQILGHPRDSKRISMLKQADFAVEAVAFERSYHNGRMPDCPVERLGKIAHGHYVQRVVIMVKALPALRRAMRRSDIVYASGQDVALLAFVAGIGLGKPIVLEVGDIREMQVAPGLKGRFIRAVDKFFIGRFSLLIATATDFIEVYYREWLHSSIPGLVIENKLESSFIEDINSKNMKEPPSGKPLTDRPLRIGYFGGLRCGWSWRVLSALAESRPNDVEIVLGGYIINPADLSEQIEKYENITYVGQYRSPQDLPSLYNKVDLIWACYQPIGPNDWNLRWARPNRFYESCFFKKPIISRFGSNDSVEVERYDIGLNINDEDIDKTVETLCKIKASDVETWTENMYKLPNDVYVYTTETEELAKALKGLVSEC